MKITLSKSQWENMGKKAGWIKTAQSTALPTWEERMGKPKPSQPRQPNSEQNISSEQRNNIMNAWRKFQEFEPLVKQTGDNQLSISTQTIKELLMNLVESASPSTTTIKR